MSTGSGLVRVLGECDFTPDWPAAGAQPVMLTVTQQKILARLALAEQAVVPYRDLEKAIWQNAPPTNSKAAIHNQISRLRAVVGEEVIRTLPGGGYALHGHTDAGVLLAYTVEAETLLENDPQRAFAIADAAIELWQGVPFLDIQHLRKAKLASARLHTVLQGLEEVRLDAAIRKAQQPVWSLAEAERLHHADPLSERRWALLVRALLHAGRAGEAAATAAAARRQLRERLGIEPGAWLAAAEAEVLGMPSEGVPDARHLPAEGENPQVRVLARLDRNEAVTTARNIAIAANQSGEHREAILWLSRCLELPDHDPHTRLMLRIELGDAQRLAGDPAHLSTLLDAASEARALGDEQALAAACVALLQLGASSTSGLPILEVRKVVELSLPLLTRAEYRAPVLAAASLASSLIGEARTSRELFLSAYELDVPPELRAQDVLPYAYMALGAPADLELRRTISQELSQHALHLSEPRVIFEAEQLRFSVALQEADGQTARDAAQGMERTVHQVSDVGRQWSMLWVRAAIAHLNGEDESCEDLAQRAHDIFAPVSPARAAAARAGQIAALRLTQGRIAELAPILSTLASAQPGIPAFQAAAACAVAETGNDTGLARSRAALALDLAQEDSTWLAGIAMAGRAVATIADQGLARRCLDRLAPWSGLGIWQGTCSYGPVDTVIALLHRTLGNEKETEQHAAIARDLAHRLQAQPFIDDIDRLGLP